MRQLAVQMPVSRLKCDFAGLLREVDVLEVCTIAASIKVQQKWGEQADVLMGMKPNALHHDAAHVCKHIHTQHNSACGLIGCGENTRWQDNRRQSASSGGERIYILTACAPSS